MADAVYWLIVAVVLAYTVLILAWCVREWRRQQRLQRILDRGEAVLDYVRRLED